MHGGSEWREGSRDVDWLGILLIAGASFPLIARRRAPLATFVVVTVVSAGSS